MNKIDQLSNVEIFKGLDQQQLDTVNDCCRIITINEGEKLFGDGEDATFLWAVIEGGVDLRFDLPGGAFFKRNDRRHHFFRKGIWVVQFCSAL